MLELLCSLPRVVDDIDHADDAEGCLEGAGGGGGEGGEGGGDGAAVGAATEPGEARAALGVDVACDDFLFGWGASSTGLTLPTTATALCTWVQKNNTRPCLRKI